MFDDHVEHDGRSESQGGVQQVTANADALAFSEIAWDDQQFTVDDARKLRSMTGRCKRE
jgi:hypothetical protein